MPVSIRGTGGGGVTLDAGAASADTTLTLPNTSGTILQSGTAVTPTQGGTGLTSTGAAGNVLFTTNGTAWSSTPKIVLGDFATASGTNVDYTGIPSWVKRVTIMLSFVSTTGSSIVQVQLGTSSGFETSSYFTFASFVTGTNTCGTAQYNTGIGTTFSSAGSFRSGCIVVNSIGGGGWAYSGILGDAATNSVVHIAGVKTLAGALDRLRLTTVNGTDTFDTGSINILYE